MTPDEIIDAFSSRTFPSKAIEACRADKDTSSQILLNLLEEFLNGAFDDASDKSMRAVDAIFLAVHLLAEFKEKRAFALLMRLLTKDSDEAEEVLGDALTETLPGILINTFDGNLDKLHRLIINININELVRSSALESLTCLTLEGTISRESTHQFLEECFDRFKPEKLPNYIWIEWTKSISALGMESFIPLVEQVFREKIDPFFMDISRFYKDLHNTLNPQTENTTRGFRKPPFDNVDSLLSWATYEQERNLDSKAIRPRSILPIGQFINPHRNVGRNDPCPCGSGKKFKKCCLQ